MLMSMSNVYSENKFVQLCTVWLIGNTGSYNLQILASYSKIRLPPLNFGLEKEIAPLKRRYCGSEG